MIYVLDNSSIRVFKDYYPNRFPSVWHEIDLLVESGRLISVREVRRELANWTGVSPHLDVWLNANAGIFKDPTTKETDFVAEIFRHAHFQQLLSKEAILDGRPVADPFLVAAANVRNGCVVTQEKHKNNAAKIPNVCSHFGVECTDVEGMFERENWKF